MKLKPITIALTVGASLMMTSCVNKAANERNTTNIFNIESQSDMAVTLYYDVEEPTVTFITPGGTKISSDGLPTDRGNGAVCYHVTNAAPGQWRMSYDKKNNGTLEVNWAPDIKNKVYTVSNIVYPDGGSQLVWCKWHTPNTEQIVNIKVTRKYEIRSLQQRYIYFG